MSWFSVIFWFCAGYPQIRMNFITKTTNGLSFQSFLIWYIGDWMCITSLFLLNAMIPQKFLGIWLGLNDSTLILQMLIFGKQKSNGKSTQIGSVELVIYISLLTLVVSIILTYYLSMRSITINNNQIFDQCEPAGQPIHYTSGIVLGYINMVMFSISRPFQVYENWKNKSCDGVSIGMFSCSMMGDYCAGIAAVLNGMSERMSKQIPYIVNGLAPAFFETIIVIQYFYYGHKNKQRRRSWSKVVEMNTI